MFVVLLALVVARLVELQVVASDRYVAYGADQRLRVADLPAERGDIVDRNGLPLVVSTIRQTVWVDPRLVTDPAGEATTLAPVLGLPVEDVRDALTSTGAFAYVARKVPDDVAERVSDLGLDGVFLIEEPDRLTPSGDLARGVIGMVDIDGVGLAGLEVAHDDLLTGRAGSIRYERDPEGHLIATGQTNRTDPVAGNGLVLTLDRSIQYEAERLLADQIVETGARGGMVIVSRPSTGEILAMVNVEASDGEPRNSANNMAVTTVFEPGSVNKMITLAAAIDQGVVSPSTRFDVPDSLPVSDHVFTDHDPHPPADWSVTDILTTSSNIGTILVAQELGGPRLDRYLRTFGFGERTALDFPNESPGLMLPVGEWSGTSIGSIPIGQGISVTALQLLSAYNVIANDGAYVPPRLVAATVDEDGRRHDLPPAPTRRAVAAETARAMSAMLANVVADGTGTAAQVPGYQVAGKTGTARKPLPTGGYRDAAGNFHYVATFAGFAPADRPEISVIVVVDEPTSSIFASAVSAPVFGDLVRFALRRYVVEPDPVVDSSGDGAVRASVAVAPVPTSTDAGETPGEESPSAIDPGAG